jgi:hypothetical protein
METRPKHLNPPLKKRRLVRPRRQCPLCTQPHYDNSARLHLEFRAITNLSGPRLKTGGSRSTRPIDIPQRPAR